MRKGKPRSNASYIRAAKKLAEFAPSLQKYAKRRTIGGKLTAAEKAAIARKEKALRHTENLHKLTPKQFKLAKKLGIAGRGISALRLRNTAPGSKIRITKEGVTVGSNGRRVRYVLAEANLGAIGDAAAAVFARETATNRVTVWLWTSAGRASRGYRSENLFMQDMAESFGKYQDQEDWIEGIAYIEENFDEGEDDEDADGDAAWDTDDDE